MKVVEQFANMGDAANEPGAKDPFVLDEDQSTPEEEQVTLTALIASIGLPLT